jgi:hypothetical protein
MRSVDRTPLIGELNTWSLSARDPSIQAGSSQTSLRGVDTSLTSTAGSSAVVRDDQLTDGRHL